MTHIKNKKRPRCKARLQSGDTLVLAAMASDCNACRAAVNIEPVMTDKKGQPLNVHPEPQWKPKPYPKLIRKKS